MSRKDIKKGKDKSMEDLGKRLREIPGSSTDGGHRKDNEVKAKEKKERERIRELRSPRKCLLDNVTEIEEKIKKTETQTQRGGNTAAIAISSGIQSEEDELYIGSEEKWKQVDKVAG